MTNTYQQYADAKPRIHFVHINKAGGSSMIEMLRNRQQCFDQHLVVRVPGNTPHDRTVDLQYLLAQILVERFQYEEAADILANVVHHRSATIGTDNHETEAAVALLAEVREVIRNRNAP